MSVRRLLVFGDVHADVAALGRVFDLAEERGVEHWICLGDVVGYGDSPAETVALLRSREGQILRGNHEAALVDDTELASFSDQAASAIRNHRKELRTHDREWLGSLPIEHRLGDLRFAHASLPRPERFRYLTASRHSAAMDLQTLVHIGEVGAALGPGETLFVGHSHLPCVWRERRGGWRAEFPTRRSYELPRGGERMVVEVGSVALQRRGRPTLVWIDLEDRSLAFQRLPRTEKQAGP